MSRHRRGRRRAPNPALATLGVRNYRRYFIGQLVSDTGTWMQRAAQDLLVLQLTGNSGTAVGVLTALQFLPQTLFGFIGGIIADRYPKRWLVVVTQTVMGLQSLVLGLLTVTGIVDQTALYVLAFVLGTATALDQPARNAFVAELVERQRVAGAVSLSSAQFNVARMLGPALAAVSVVVGGAGPVFLANSVSYLAVLFGLVTLRADELHPPQAPKKREVLLRDALRHVAATPDLLLPMSAIAFIGTFGLNFQVTSSLIAVTVFHSGPASYGYLSAAYAAGGLAGALRGAVRGTARRNTPTARRLVTAAVSFGLLEAATGLMPGYLSFLVLLIPTGVASSTVLTTASSLIQLTANPAMRGRVMSLYLLLLLGGTPIGAPLVGLVSDTLGARYSLILGGLISAVSAVVLAGLVRARSPGPYPVVAPRPDAGHGVARLLRHRHRAGLVKGRASPGGVPVRS
jgi:MFS family permease